MAITELRCAGILFDLDGTLIDSGDAVVRAWTAFAQETGRDPQEILAMCHGVRTVEVIARLGVDMAIREAALKVEAGIIDAGSAPIPGAIDLLESLPPDAWAVVTSSLTETAWSRFETTPLPAPRFIVSADDVEHGKPDPAGYLLGARRLGLPNDLCLVVEDAPAGVAAAVSAGMRSVAVETTSSVATLTAADHVVRDLRGVTLADANQATDGTWELRLLVDEAQ